MNVVQAIQSRQSCRQFLDRPVEREKLIACVEAGRIAPSACNAQQWAFVVVDQPQLCQQIANALIDEQLGVNTFAHQIPAYIVLVSHPPRYLSDRSRKILAVQNYATTDLGIAAAQICLTATQLGLGSLMMGWMRQDQVRQALQIPDEQTAALIIGLGYAKSQDIRPKKRDSLQQVIHFNGYQTV